MPASASKNVPASAGSLTLASCISFVPIGIATVLLGPMLPVLSARWSMNYSQAGALFAVQYVSSTVAVALSGVLVSRYGFRFPIKTGLLLMAAGLALLMTGPKALALICIAANGAGLGLATPAGNLLVAELNHERRSASLSWLNFYWSAGAVSCPFLVAFAAKVHEVPVLLACVSAFSLLVALVFAVLPDPIFEIAKTSGTAKTALPAIQRKLNSFLILAA
ncbi:MAG TPA: MFS transporter, partial [Candidatus Binatia bacterium]|nr:MFS transporter [Candidatus Binatia bacterium]